MSSAMGKGDIAMVTQDVGGARRGDMVELARRLTRRGEPHWEVYRTTLAGHRLEFTVPERLLEKARG